MTSDSRPKATIRSTPAQAQTLQRIFLRGAGLFLRAELHEPFRLYAYLHPFQREIEALGSRSVGSGLQPPKTAAVMFL